MPRTATCIGGERSAHARVLWHRSGLVTQVPVDWPHATRQMPSTGVALALAPCPHLWGPCHSHRHPGSFSHCALCQHLGHPAADRRPSDKQTHPGQQSGSSASPESQHGHPDVRLSCTGQRAGSRALSLSTDSSCFQQGAKNPSVFLTHTCQSTPGHCLEHITSLLKSHHI